jgi:hypothetical protein
VQHFIDNDFPNFREFFSTNSNILYNIQTELYTNKKIIELVDNILDSLGLKSKEQSKTEKIDLIPFVN